MKAITYREQADRLPPVVCFLLARKNGRPVRLIDIRATTGIPRRRVNAIAKASSWGGFTVDEMDAFRAACGITRANERRHIEFMRKTSVRMQQGGGLRHLSYVHPKTLRMITEALSAVSAKRTSC